MENSWLPKHNIVVKGCRFHMKPNYQTMGLLFTEDRSPTIRNRLDKHRGQCACLAPSLPWLLLDRWATCGQPKLIAAAASRGDSVSAPWDKYGTRTSTWAPPAVTARRARIYYRSKSDRRCSWQFVLCILSISPRMTTQGLRERFCVVP